MGAQVSHAQGLHQDLRVQGNKASSPHGPLACGSPVCPDGLRLLANRHLSPTSQALVLTELVLAKPRMPPDLRHLPHKGEITVVAVQGTSNSLMDNPRPSAPHDNAIPSANHLSMERPRTSVDSSRWDPCLATTCCKSSLHVLHSYHHVAQHPENTQLWYDTSARADRWACCRDQSLRNGGPLGSHASSTNVDLPTQFGNINFGSGFAGSFDSNAHNQVSPASKPCSKHLVIPWIKAMRCLSSSAPKDPWTPPLSTFWRWSGSEEWSYTCQTCLVSAEAPRQQPDSSCVLQDTSALSGNSATTSFSKPLGGDFGDPLNSQRQAFPSAFSQVGRRTLCLLCPSSCLPLGW